MPKRALIQSALFEDEPSVDDGLPPDQYRTCGVCHDRFYSVVHRARPTFVPLLCAKCDVGLVKTVPQPQPPRPPLTGLARLSAKLGRRR